MSTTQFQLGDTLQDKITGIKGIATGHLKWLTGCDQWVLQPKPKKGETALPDQYTFDENRLKKTATKRVEIGDTKDTATKRVEIGDTKYTAKKGGPTPMYKSSKPFQS